MGMPFKGRYDRFRKLQKPVCLVMLAILALAGYFFIAR